MSLEDLKKRLQDLYNNGVYDNEEAHAKADDALLEYINDPEITEAYNKMEKWYA